MLLKIGSKGKEVADVQSKIGATVDGVYGYKTAKAVKKWQLENNLSPDGVVGQQTWEAMFPSSTDNAERSYTTNNGLFIENYPLSKGEYKEGPTEKEYLFLHHTAGWHNPYKVIEDWERDDRGTIATEFVIGGQSVRGNNDDFDGLVLKCFPSDSFAWHLGDNGSRYMHTHSVGIEVCNFGYLENGKTYSGATAAQNQQVTLKNSFRGYEQWHKYSDKQIESLELLILHIANRDNIDVREGLVAEIKKRAPEKVAEAFEFNEDAYYGRTKGMWTHTNTRRDKTDMFPQEELINMLLDL